MRLAKLVVTLGRTPALIAAKKFTLAGGLESAIENLEKVVEKEGVMPFDSRPKSTQKVLNKANSRISKADDWLWQNRNMEV